MDYVIIDGKLRTGGLDVTRPDTRTRMLNSAIALLRERGAGGVTIDAVLAHSGAPRGSVYHHFPGGRDEMLLTGARQAADFITHLIDVAAADGDPGTAIDTFVEFWRQSLLATDYRAGCPVVALAVDSRDDLPDASELVRTTFDVWQTKLTALLVESGHPKARARALATMAVASIEGAVLLCRSERSDVPLTTVAAELRRLL